METAILLGQTLLVALITVWLVIGTIENIRVPSLNGDLVARVLSMQDIENEMPEAYALLKGKAITSSLWHERIFRFIVIVEIVVSLILSLATLLLAAACLGLADPQLAKLVAIYGSIGFTAIWGGFLVGGQWVHYWCAHKETQKTHYLMTIWGVVTFLALAVS